MRVITFDEQKLFSVCKELESKIKDSYTPDIVVGIASGGVYVAENMFSNINHVAITCRRKSTDTKSSLRFIKKIIASLPEWVRNFMRIAESRILRLFSCKSDLQPLVLDDDLQHILKNAKDILIVDDAVDSGATLLKVKESIQNIAQNASCMSAVLTVTTPNPLIRPDFCMYDNGTLIRFPWSMDAR